MFIRCFAELAEPYALAQSAIVQPAREWFPDVELTDDEGGAIHARLETELGGITLQKRIEIVVGPAVLGPSKTVVPVVWRATGPGVLFPILTGQVEVAPAPGGHTLLALMGEYQPPLGALGAKLDEALLHEVAWRTLMRFRDKLASRLAAVGNQGRR